MSTFGDEGAATVSARTGRTDAPVEKVHEVLQILRN
jgi:hypothetical protein